jgi:hypothetical protein
MDQPQNREAKRTMRGWLFLPQLAGVLAFSAAFIVLFVSGTNRLAVDMYLGLAGFIATGLAGVALLAAIILHPWRRAEKSDWLVLAAHVAGLLVCFLLGFFWIGFHLA